MLTQKEINKIKKIYLDERACGHLICDFDDYENDLRVIAEEFGYDVWWNDDDELQIEERLNVEELLNYYYELHS